MEVLRSVKTELEYVRKIAVAGWKGIHSAPQESKRAPLGPTWVPPLAGAITGVLARAVIGKRRSTAGLAFGGVVGSVVGLGAGVAWESRQTIRAAARKSLRAMNEVRDARWLEENPIDYA